MAANNDPEVTQPTVAPIVLRNGTLKDPITHRFLPGKAGGRPSDAYGELAAEFARSALANAMDKPRDATAAAKLALSLARMAPADHQQQSAAAADGLAVTGAGIDFLRDLLQRAAPQVIHVVEGEAHELED